jgi:hypothetical protein
VQIGQCQRTCWNPGLWIDANHGIISECCQCWQNGGCNHSTACQVFWSQFRC